MRVIREHGGQDEDTGASGGRLMRTIIPGQVKGACLRRKSGRREKLEKRRGKKGAWEESSCSGEFVVVRTVQRRRKRRRWLWWKKTRKIRVEERERRCMKGDRSCELLVMGMEYRKRRR